LTINPPRIKTQAGRILADLRWRGEHRPLVGEFAYQAKCDRKKRIHEKAKKLCEQFFVTLQLDVQDWILLGTTKTGMVYRLNGDPPQSHE